VVSTPSLPLQHTPPTGRQAPSTIHNGPPGGGSSDALWRNTIVLLDNVSPTNRPPTRINSPRTPAMTLPLPFLGDEGIGGGAVIKLSFGCPDGVGGGGGIAPLLGAVGAAGLSI
jgi:hypothetical protein